MISPFRTRPGVSFLIVLTILATACSSAAAPPAPTSPPAPAKNEPAAKAPAQAKSEPAAQAPAAAAAAPASSSGAAAPAGSWDEIVAAAKREGSIVLSTHAGTGYTKFAEKAKESLAGTIDVQATTIRASDFAPRVLSEQRNGVFAWDVHVGPMTNISAILAPAGALQPIKPYLEKLPADIRDDSKWAGGLEVYTDPARPLSLNVHFTINGGFYVNRDLAPASELKSYEDLIDPKWKGKIVIYDPRSANAASETLNTFLSVAGESFVEKLIMEQDMVVVGAGRQATEWVAQGRYPIAIGADPTALAELQQAGVGKNVELVRSTDVRLSQFGMSVLTNAPHPNASIVFMNWFLSHDGQDAWASLSTLDSNSRRFDVPVYRPESRPDYNNLGQYKLWDATEAYQTGMKKAIEIANKKPS